MSLKSLHSVESGWLESLGHAPALHHNDAGSELAARNQYKSDRERDCGKKFPGGKLTYCCNFKKCVEKAMNDYDGIVGAEQAAKKKADEDARLALLELQHTENVQAQAGAVTQVETAKTASIEATTSATMQQYMAVAGLLILVVGGFFLYKKYMEVPAVAVA